jgi:hypothetical protein
MIQMDDDFLIAQVSAVELVGTGVWMKLSELTRARILNEELRTLNAKQETQAVIGASSTGNHDAGVLPA